MEWIEERLSRVQEVLERRTEQSALLLDDVLGPIPLEPKRGRQSAGPIYLAETSIACIVLPKRRPEPKPRTAVPLEVALLDTAGTSR